MTTGTYYKTKLFRDRETRGLYCVVSRWDAHTSSFVRIGRTQVMCDLPMAAKARTAADRLARRTAKSRDERALLVTA